MKRSECFDVLKGIGILCVFYGHTALSMSLPARLMFNFHIPLFFLVSGMFFAPQKSLDFKSLMVRIWRGLLLPYCLFVLVGYAVHFESTYVRWTSALPSECVRVIHGEGSDSVWFLVCLASVQVIVWTLWRSLRDYSILRWLKLPFLLAIGGGAHIISKYAPKDVVSTMPFMLASVPSAMLFFMIGFWGKDLFHRFEKAKLSMRVMLCALLMFILPFVGFTAMMHYTLDIRSATFNLVLIPLTFLGFAVSFVVAKLCMAWYGTKNVLTAIGRRSLCLFAWELPIAYVLSRMTNGFIPYPTAAFQHPWFVGALRMVVVLALAYVVSYPTVWLLGKLVGGHR